MTNPTKKEWEREFEKLLSSFNKDMKEAVLMFDEVGWTDKLKFFIQQTIDKEVKEVEIKTLRQVIEAIKNGNLTDYLERMFTFYNFEKELKEGK